MQLKIIFAFIFFLGAWALGLLYYAYLFDLLIALLLCISSFWIKLYLQRFLKYNLLSSLCTVFLMVTVLLVPLGFVFWRAIGGLQNLDWRRIEPLFAEFKARLENLLDSFPALKELILSIAPSNPIDELSLSKLSGLLLKYTSTLAQGSLNFIVDGSLIVVFLFVFLCWGERLHAYMIGILPFNDDQIDHVSHEVSGTLRVVFLSTLFNIAMQGSAFGLIASLYGFNGVLLGIIYGFCSLIPLVGGGLVWVPISLILYFLGDLKGAIIVALYSAIFIGFVIDNLVKPWLIGLVSRRVLPRPLELSEFLIFFAILAGLGAFGFWGIIIGPAINALFIALLRVYERDFLGRQPPA